MLKDECGILDEAHGFYHHDVEEMEQEKKDRREHEKAMRKVEHANRWHAERMKKAQKTEEEHQQGKKKSNTSGLFTLVKPRGANVISGVDEWIEVEFMIDIRATDTVMPADELEEVPVD